MGTMIGANGGSSSGGGSAANAVKYVVQSLTDAQKAQARTNIDAAKNTPVSSPAAASSYELAVDTMTNLGTLTGEITLTLATAPSDSKVHIYAFTFTADSTTAPTMTWPSGISWAGGSAPTITAGKSYEVSICQLKTLISEF